MRYCCSDGACVVPGMKHEIHYEFSSGQVEPVDIPVCQQYQQFEMNQ